MKAQHIDNKPVTDLNKIRNMQILLSYAIREISKKVQLECSERAILLNMIWLTSIKEINSLAKLYEKLNDKKQEEVTSSIKTHVGNCELLNLKIKELETVITTLNDKDKRKDSIISLLQEDNTVLHDRIKKLSEIFDGVMNSKSDQIRNEMERQKDFLIKSVNDTPLNFRDEYGQLKIDKPFIDEAVSARVESLDNKEAEIQTEPLSKEAIRYLKSTYIIKGEISNDKGKNMNNIRLSIQPMNISHSTLKKESPDSPSLKKVTRIPRKYPIPSTHVGVNVCMPNIYINPDKIKEYNLFETKCDSSLLRQSSSNISLDSDDNNTKKSNSKGDSPTNDPKKQNAINSQFHPNKRASNDSIESSKGSPHSPNSKKSIRHGKNGRNDPNFIPDFDENYGNNTKTEAKANKKSKVEVFKSATKNLVILKNIGKLQKKIEFKKNINNIISSSLKGLLDNDQLAVIQERLIKNFDKEEKKKRQADSVPQKKKVSIPKAIRKEVQSKTTQKESDDEVDPSYLHMEDVATELPHKLLATLDKLSYKISSLDTNEYGDYVYDKKSTDPKVEKIKHNANILTTLLENLYDSRPKSDKITIMFNRETMTDNDLFSQINENENGENQRPKSAQGRPALSVNQAKAQQIYYRKPISIYAPVKLTITEIQPFKFVRFKQRQRVHPVYNILTEITCNYRNPKYKRNLMPIKTLIKSIMMFYNEKIAGSKDSIYFKNQKLAEFVYNSLIHRYGLQQVAERKFLELCVTAYHLMAKAAMIEIFTKFMGIHDVNYSNDDLNFYFLMSIYFQQECPEKTKVGKREHVFSIDLPTFRKVKNLLEMANTFFVSKVDKNDLEKLQNKIRSLVKKDNELSLNKNIPDSELDERILHVDIFMSHCIEAYREIKLTLQKKLLERKIITRLISYEDDNYTKQEFIKILEAINAQTYSDIDIENFYQNNGRFVAEPTNTNGAMEKRLQLETILSFMINNNIHMTL